MDKPDEVLGTNSWRAHTTTKNRRSSEKDTPVLMLLNVTRKCKREKAGPSVDVPARAEYA